MTGSTVSRRRFLAGTSVGAAGVLGLALTACGDDDAPPFSNAAPRSPTSGAPRRGGTLRAVGGPVGSALDVQRAKTMPESLLWQWTSNFLMRLSAASPFLPEPDLALAQPEIPADGLLLTFRLRPDATWQDRQPVGGRPVTADDVKASFDRLKALAQKSPRSGNYSNVESVIALDPTTVQFKLKSPQADLLSIMADQYDVIIPKEVAARGDEAVKSAEDVIGSGPYELAFFDPGRRVQVRRRADSFWRPNTAWLDGWELVTLLDEGQKANALFSGQADLADVPAVIARIFDRDTNFQVLRATTTARECLFINHAAGPLKDARVRQAIWRAIDRRDLYGAAFEGAGIPGGPVTPAGVAWALPDAELQRLPGFGDRATELAEAKKLLAAAGFPNGFDEKVITVDAMKLPMVAEAVSADLAEAGIRLQTEVVGSDLPVLQERLRKGEFTLAATTVLAGIYPDAQLYLYHHSKNGAANYGRYASTDLDAKLDRQRGMYNVAERMPLVQDIQRSIVNNPGPIWLGSRVQATVASSRVRNVVTAPFAAGYDTAENAWLRQ